MPDTTLDVKEFAGSRLFDEAPCYISVQDRDFRIIATNRRLIQDFGEHLFERCYTIYQGRAEACPECPVVRTFEDGKEHTGEQTVFDRRGLPHRVLVNTSALHDPSGQIVAVIKLFTDITIQKELEHRLHDSLSRFHNLFDVVPCYISVQDRDFQIVEANQRFKESFGGRLGGHCYEIYKKRSDRCPKCPVAETFADGRMHTAEEVVIDNACNKVYVAVYTAPVRDSRGQITEVMEVSADITEIRILQDKLASLGQLVGGIAHSIKNVLEGLRGGVYVTNLGFRDNSQEDIRTGWEMVERNVGRLSAMIMDMLYCAKDRSPRRLPVSLPAVAKEVLALLMPRTKDFSIQLEAEIAEDVPTLLAEPRDIHSLISNLISNAMDACITDQNEQKDYRVVLRVFQQSGQAVIEVQDNGAGMDQETQGKLFTMFFSTKGTFGTGLGLLVAHKVATEHGGTILVSSTPGEGSTFTVRLPLEAKT